MLDIVEDVFAQLQEETVKLSTALQLVLSCGKS